MNYLNKEFVKSYKFSTVQDPKCGNLVSTTERINGNTYLVSTRANTTTVVGNLYKVMDPSEKQFNYVLLCGVSYQNLTENPTDLDTELEVAAIRAQMRPQAVMYFEDILDDTQFENIAKIYDKPVYLIMTQTSNNSSKEYEKELSYQEKMDALNYAFEKYN